MKAWSDLEKGSANFGEAHMVRSQKKANFKIVNWAYQLRKPLCTQSLLLHKQKYLEFNNTFEYQLFLYTNGTTADRNTVHSSAVNMHYLSIAKIAVLPEMAFNP